MIFVRKVLRLSAKLRGKSRKTRSQIPFSSSPLQRARTHRRLNQTLAWATQSQNVHNVLCTFLAPPKLATSQGGDEHRSAQGCQCAHGCELVGVQFCSLAAAGSFALPRNSLLSESRLQLSACHGQLPEAPCAWCAFSRVSFSTQLVARCELVVHA